MDKLRSPYHDAMKIAGEMAERDAWSAKASDFSNDWSLWKQVGQTDQKGKFDDIVNLFYNRFETIQEIFRTQAGFKASGSIKQILREKKRTKDYNIIGLVQDARRTKSGGKMLTLEDRTGVINVFVRKDDPAYATILNDDVVGYGRFDKKAEKCLGESCSFPRNSSKQSKQSGAI